MEKTAADIYLQELQDQICRAGVDYRYWFTHFHQSVENLKRTTDPETTKKFMTEMEAAEGYIKSNRKKMFDALEKYSFELEERKRSQAPPT